MNTYEILAQFYECNADKTLYKHYLKLIERYKTPCSVLEIGCGSGHLSRQLAKKNYRVTALDRTIEMLTTAAYHAHQEDVEIAFLLHDIIEPLRLTFDLILMPYDVVNHAENVDDAIHMVENAIASLNPDGVLIFDLLKCEYIEHLIGHQETFNTGQGKLSWQVKKSSEECAHTHIVTIDDKQATHTTRGFSKERLLKDQPNVTQKDSIDLKDRTILVYIKEEK